MAIVIEDHCVCCGLPCINCGRRRQEVIRCDTYGCEDYAEYTMDGEDFCKEHAEEYLVEKFKELTVYEMAALLDIKISHCSI